LDLCGKNFSGANMLTWASETNLLQMVAQFFSVFDADSYIPLPDPGKHVNEELAEAFKTMISHGSRCHVRFQGSCERSDEKEAR
jgi:hypothetical protein